ncbi:MAG: 2-oxo acid dehydrogenase subunit E2, partial [Planctomycetota bacterium]
AGLEIKPRDVLLHAAAQLLPEHPLLNACFAEDAVLVYEPVNVGLAFDVERDDSVLVPVVREADQKPLAELAADTAALERKLAAHELGPADLADATFTLSDQSALGIDRFVPILNARQSALLAVGSIRPRPVVRGEAVAVAPVATLAVAFDHRVLNGTTAARFLTAVRERLEALG